MPTTPSAQEPDKSKCAFSNPENSASIHPAVGVVQIVPALPPKIDGVGDFAFALAAEMHTAFSVSTVFALRHAGAGQPNTINIPLESQSTLDNRLTEQLPSFVGPVILHYVGYGYHPFGSPDWLSHAICKIKAKGHRIITIFHELYATGRPWQRAFWNSQAQKTVFEALVRASDVCVTSNPVYLHHIKQVNCAVHVVMLPIPSNMGELKIASPLTSRKRQMVIAGREPSKNKVLANPNVTLEACSRLQLSEIVEVGEPSEHSVQVCQAAGNRGIHYRCTGWLPSENISGIFAESYCGICAYPSELWQKSGVIASYHAHGLLTILIPEKRGRKGLLDQHLAVSVHDLSTNMCPVSPALELIARSGFDSYTQSRTIGRYASRLSTLISPDRASRERTRVADTGADKPC